MTHTITNEETNRNFTFADEAAWEAAMDWYNASTKADIISFCEGNGVSLNETTTEPYFKGGVKLVSDWADVAMELWAAKQ